MSPIEFTVNQLRIASEYNPPQEKVRLSSNDIDEKMMSEILDILKNEDGLTRAEIAEVMGRNEFTIRARLQELARQERVVMCMQAHNKPAIYKIKK
ncbi:MAG: hypothetical protein ACXU8A_00080 [Burkholderiaceae bacterium]